MYLFYMKFISNESTFILYIPTSPQIQLKCVGKILLYIRTLYCFIIGIQ